MRQLVDFGLDVFFCRIVGNVDEGGFIGHQPTFGAEVGEVAQCFHRFQGDDEVAFSCGNEVRSDGLVADAQVGLHVAASLAHAVYFCLLHVESVLEGCFADYGGDGEDTLSSYAGKYDVFFHGFTCFFFCVLMFGCILCGG